jgi:hypothetical protein
VKERAARHRGRLRAWHPGTGDPFLLLIADVIAYQTDKKMAKRSTRRRQDAPNLPRRKVAKTTVGREYAG